MTFDEVVMGNGRRFFQIDSWKIVWAIEVVESPLPVAFTVFIDSRVEKTLTSGSEQWLKRYELGLRADRDGGSRLFLVYMSARPVVGKECGSTTIGNGGKLLHGLENNRCEE